MALHDPSLFHEDLGLVMNMTTTPSSFDTANATLLYSNNHTNNTNAATPDDDHPLGTALLSMGWVVLFMYYCCRSKIPDERHWRGREMHQRALEARQIELAQEARDNQSPLERQRLVQNAMITKIVISQDQQGNLTLGDEDHVDNNRQETTMNKATAPDASSVTHSLCPEDDDEESACVICLEPFRVGDCVTWSRNSRELNCLHIFHSDCILLWLEEKRHDDCPSCRSTLILQSPTTPIPHNHNNDNHTEGGDLEKDDEDDDVEQYEEDLNNASCSNNVFVIMHGLVSSAARRANNYSLVGQDLEIETADDDDVPEAIPYSLSIPSPLRRVMSHGSHFSLGDSVRGLFRRRLSFSRSTSNDEDSGKNGDTSVPNNNDHDMEVLQRSYSLRRTASEGLGIHTGARRSFATTLPLLPPPSSSGIRRRGVSSGSGNRSTVASVHTATSESSEHSEEDNLEWLQTNRSSWQSGGSLSSALDDILDIPEGSGDIELGERERSPNRSKVIE